MFSERQTLIIKKILGNTQRVHASVLADTLNVSSKTIRNEIIEINRIFKYQLIESNNKIGYKIKGQHIPEIKEILNRTVNKQDGALFRKFEILGKLLFDYEVSFDSLSETINYSSQIAKKEVLKLDQYILRNYNRKILKIDVDTVSIEAEEEVIREVLFKIMKDSVTSDKLDSDKLLEKILDDGFNAETYMEIRKALLDVLKNLNIQISNENIKIFEATLCISVTRNQYGHYIENQANDNNDVILESLLEKLIDLKEQDIALLYKLLHTFKITKSDTKVEITEFSGILLDEFIDEVFDKYNFNLKESDDLYNNMLVHIEYMLRRIENDYELRNPIILDIKKKYPFAYEVSMLIVHIVYKYKNKYILDDEVSYLAIYVQHYLENINEKIRAVLISSQRHSINKVLENWISMNFKNQISVQKILDKTSVNNFNLAEFDMIMTFDDSVYNADIETFTFNGLPDTKDVHRLNECIHAVKMNQRIKTALYQYLNIDLVKIFEEPSFETVINDLSIAMEEKGIIASATEFSEDVVKREVNYPTNLDDALMIPHPIYTFANKTTVAVGIINKGFIHNGEVIRLVFLLGFERVRNPEVNLLFQFFKQISGNKKLLKKLYESTSKEEFLTNITKFNLAHSE